MSLLKGGAFILCLAIVLDSRVSRQVAGDVVIRRGPESRKSTHRFAPTRPPNELLFLDLSDHPGRIPRHDRIRWNTPGDDRTCTHHGIGAYPHPWQEDRTIP